VGSGSGGTGDGDPGITVFVTRTGLVGGIVGDDVKEGAGSGTDSAVSPAVTDGALEGVTAGWEAGPAHPARTNTSRVGPINFPMTFIVAKKDQEFKPGN
jgi:hypothetical protein